MTKAVERHAQAQDRGAAGRRQARIDRAEEAVVGVNKYRTADPEKVDVLDIDNSDVRATQSAAGAGRSSRISRRGRGGAERAAGRSRADETG